VQVRDPRRPDFGGTVPILRAVFRVPPGYMAEHICTAFRNFWITLTKRNQVFSALVALSFSTYNSALIFDLPS
jgi:hypothetical protein